MKERLDHLYAMHAINVQMQDRVAIQEDDNPFMDDEAEHLKAVDSNTDMVKTEDDEQHTTAYSPQLQNDYSQFRSHINGSPPLSSSPTNGSPGAFHRHWKANLVSPLSGTCQNCTDSLGFCLGKPNYHGR